MILIITVMIVYNSRMVMITIMLVMMIMILMMIRV